MFWQSNVRYWHGVPESFCVLGNLHLFGVVVDAENLSGLDFVLL